MPSVEFKNLIIKYFINAGIAAAASFSGEWDTDADYVLRHIFVKADGVAATKSTVTIRIDNRPLTKDKALCNIFGSNAEDAILLGIRMPKGTKIDYEGTNNEGATKDFTVELIMEKV